MRILQEMNGPLRMTRQLLGKILVNGDFISPDDLQEAIERQHQTSAQLGEILVGMGVLSDDELGVILSVQREFVSPKAAMKAAAGISELLGELLLRAKRLTPESVESALEEQHQTGEKLGSIFVRMGVLHESELEAVLAFQRQQRAKRTDPSPLRLGEVLVRMRVITREKINEALRSQKGSQKKIGEVLVEAGHIKPDQLSRGLRLQQKLLTAALVTALSFSSVVCAHAFNLPPSRAGAQAPISITSAVKAHTSLKTVRQVQEIVVSNSDVDRGYVEVPAASAVGVESISPNEPITIEGLNWPFQEARLEKDPGESRTGGGADRIQGSDLQGATAKKLSYRFILAENARPGTYIWPLTISIQPL